MRPGKFLLYSGPWKKSDATLAVGHYLKLPAGFYLPLFP